MSQEKKALIKYPQKKVMRAVIWWGPHNVWVENNIPKPKIMDPKDAIVRVTSTSICGADIHLYHSRISPISTGDPLGHEAMGIVEEIGSEVKELKVNDRVVVSCCLSNGTCESCKSGTMESCECCNKHIWHGQEHNDLRRAMSGIVHRGNGGQAEYIRVPLADFNCLKVPKELFDRQVLFLSETICTGWYACELGNVISGKTVACWGLGPVGLCTLYWAMKRGASRVIGIDYAPYRLRVAKSKGFEVINLKHQDVVSTLRKMVPGGPDVCVDAVGFRFPATWRHTIERAARLETDTTESVTEAILSVKRNGTVVIVGDYIGWCDRFPLREIVHKNISIRGGQVFPQKYWKELLTKIQRGEADFSWLVTHVVPFDEAPEAYEMYDKKDVLKIILKPHCNAIVRHPC